MSCILKISMICIYVQNLCPYCLAVISPNERINVIAFLIPQDPDGYFLEQLPLIEMLTADELKKGIAIKKVTPDNKDFQWESLAINALMYQQYEDALYLIEEHAKKLEDTPDYYKAFNALIYERLKRWPEAERSWAMLGDSGEDVRLVQLHLISAAIQQRKILRATDLINEYPNSTRDKKEETDQLNIHLNAVKHFAMGDYFEARRLFIKASQFPTSFPETYLGLCYLSMNETDNYDAVGWLKKALSGFSPPTASMLLTSKSFLPLKEHESFQALTAEYQLNKNGTQLNIADLSASQLLSEYKDKISLPEYLRIKLQLKIYNENTKVRTMRFR